MFVVCAIALLCFMTVGHSAPLVCKDVVKPADQLDPRHLEGRWIMVAGSMNVAEATPPLEQGSSVTIDFYNSTFVRTLRIGHHCHYYNHNVSIEGSKFNYNVGQLSNFTGTIFHTSCSDCVVLSWIVNSPNYKSVEFYLFSKRRQVDEKELREFITQVECLEMPKHFVMDPTEQLCPVYPGIGPN